MSHNQIVLIMLRLKFLKTLALCLPLLAGLLFYVFSCGEEACKDEGLNPIHYKNSCGFDVYVKKLKEGCFVLALEDYEKVPEFTKVLWYDRITGEVRLKDREYRLYYTHATNALIKKLSLNVAGTKLRIFEAYTTDFVFNSAQEPLPLCYEGLAIEDQITVIGSLVRAEKRVSSRADSR